MRYLITYEVDSDFGYFSDDLCVDADSEEAALAYFDCYYGGFGLLEIVAVGGGE